MSGEVFCGRTDGRTADGREKEKEKLRFRVAHSFETEGGSIFAS